VGALQFSRLTMNSPRLALKSGHWNYLRGTTEKKYATLRIFQTVDSQPFEAFSF